MGIREDLLKLAVEIGPRGAGTPGEAKAAAYIRERFQSRGLEARMQEFLQQTDDARGGGDQLGKESGRKPPVQ